MFLLINKSPGPTSHDIINQLRKITGFKTIGHAGALDPFAEGLLIVGIQRPSTKQLGQLSKLDKTYQAVLQLGAISDTYDLSGQISQAPGRLDNKSINQKDIQQVLKKFTGPQLQTPPIYSAKKINGQKAYQLARQGKPVQLKPQQINIYQLTYQNFDPATQRLTIEINCSSGTYIRSLAHDIGQALGCGAYLIQLIRTQIGPFYLSQTVKLNQLTKDNWQKFTFEQLPELNSNQPND